MKIGLSLGFNHLQVCFSVTAMRVSAFLMLPSLITAQTIGDPSSIANAVANVLGVAANVSEAVNANDLANIFGNASAVAGDVRN